MPISAFMKNESVTWIGATRYCRRVLAQVMDRSGAPIGWGRTWNHP